MDESFSYLLPDEELESMPCKDQNIFVYRKGKKVRLVYENCQFDQLEHRQIAEFKQYALKHHFNANDVPDKTLMRYLYSFQFDNKQALDKLKIYLDWYQNPVIQRQDSITLQLINQGVVYTYGRDKDMRPIIFLNIALMDMDKYKLDDYLSAINAVVTLVVEKMFIKGKLQNYLFIIDTGNKGFSSLALGTVKQMVLKLSYVYSMRMGRLLVINCNTIIKMMYSAVSPFLADITKEKIKLFSGSEVQKGKITQFVSSNQLQKKYGGELQNLNEKWPPRIPGKEFMKKTKQEKQLQRHKRNYNHQNSQKTQLEQKYGENHQIMKACCQIKQCIIF